GTDAQRERCRAALEEVARTTTEIPSIDFAFVYEGTVGRVLGLLDAALGRFDLAERALREAHALAIARGHRPWIAQLGSELADGLGARGASAKVEVEALRRQAHALARELGMIGLEASTASASAAPEAIVLRAAEPIRVAKQGDQVRIERGDRAAWVKQSR